MAIRRTSDRAAFGRAALGRPGGVLPDVLAPGLAIVFCGTAAGASSAAQGAYYAGPGNAFWPTLFEVGLIPLALRPRDFARCLEWQLGFTDLAKQAQGSDAGLSAEHFDAARLHRLILSFGPRIVAFTGKRAAAEFLGRPVDYGLLPATVGQTRLFVLPSPSGAARRYWDAVPWWQLARLKSTG
jgi:TDG/mug DNA glycosylase family protein